METQETQETQATKKDKTHIEKCLETYIFRFSIKLFLGEVANFGVANVKAYLKHIFGEDKGTFVYYKYGRKIYSRIKERMKKQKLRVKQSEKIQELQAKYPNLDILKAFTYARLNGKFEVENEDIEIFENIIKLLYKK
ncbi:hypothetical protein HPMG_01094 [Helicobacter pullorum MIT 98-5489]|uniref:Uncharacterized protein n=1 Tax=Helicobacter pullorum MIT 98-5489 TaxID=537972 RepID=C5F043_9HELI|nr:hypothetical protein [Helicobacter pullorum]HEH5010706.1 hypothetical protein [Campylobacter coli]EEQ63637.1 hypothetical protein HPMG_01094 [Helicobacter pullorum MIT 98-5489]HEH5040762.1 hypothetical protein [Campylobacter coli]HEH5151790.1 hypothetical protein [Campylobacter coli]HEH5389587.1 hypothetical protein [Campylobacter coli]